MELLKDPRIFFSKETISRRLKAPCLCSHIPYTPISTRSFCCWREPARLSVWCSVCPCSSQYSELGSLGGWVGLQWVLGLLLATSSLHVNCVLWRRSRLFHRHVVLMAKDGSSDWRRKRRLTEGHFGSHPHHQHCPTACHADPVQCLSIQLDSQAFKEHPARPRSTLQDQGAQREQSTPHFPLSLA